MAFMNASLIELPSQNLSGMPLTEVTGLPPEKLFNVLSLHDDEFAAHLKGFGNRISALSDGSPLQWPEQPEVETEDYTVGVADTVTIQTADILALLEQESPDQQKPTGNLLLSRLKSIGSVALTNAKNIFTTAFTPPLLELVPINNDDTLQTQWPEQPDVVTPPSFSLIDHWGNVRLLTIEPGNISRSMVEIDAHDDPRIEAIETIQELCSHWGIPSYVLSELDEDVLNAAFANFPFWENSDIGGPFTTHDVPVLIELLAKEVSARAALDNATDIEKVAAVTLAKLTGPAELDIRLDRIKEVARCVIRYLTEPDASYYANTHNAYDEAFGWEEAAYNVFGDSPFALDTSRERSLSSPQNNAERPEVILDGVIVDGDGVPKATNRFSIVFSSLIHKVSSIKRTSQRLFRDLSRTSGH
jgi:hypothetical protein